MRTVTAKAIRFPGTAVTQSEPPCSMWVLGIKLGRAARVFNW